MQIHGEHGTAHGVEELMTDEHLECWRKLCKDRIAQVLDGAIPAERKPVWHAPLSAVRAAGETPFPADVVENTLTDLREKVSAHYCQTHCANPTDTMSHS